MVSIGLILFENFLADRRLYGRARARWRNYVIELATKKGLSIQKYINDADDFDGNPIYSAQFPDLNRAIRIVQIDPLEVSDLLVLTGWIDTIQIKQEKQPITELVIHLVLTKETEEIAQEWIERWLVDELTIVDIEQVIEQQCLIPVVDQ